MTTNCYGLLPITKWFRSGGLNAIHQANNAPQLSVNLIAAEGAGKRVAFRAGVGGHNSIMRCKW